ncbi:MAG: hypothetical protein ACLP2P_07205 [Desulfobaccales bacterium]
MGRQDGDFPIQAKEIPSNLKGVTTNTSRAGGEFGGTEQKSH